MSFRELPVRRVAVMGLGILIMGMGVALFKLSLMGNDPNSAMVMAAADYIGMDFSVVLILKNSLVFIVELLLGRKYSISGAVSLRIPSAPWRRSCWAASLALARWSVRWVWDHLLRFSTVMFRKNSAA